MFEGHLHLLRAAVKIRHDFSSNTQHTVGDPVTPAVERTVIQRERELNDDDNKKEWSIQVGLHCESEVKKFRKGLGSPRDLALLV